MISKIQQWLTYDIEYYFSEAMLLLNQRKKP